MFLDQEQEIIETNNQLFEKFQNEKINQLSLRKPVTLISNSTLTEAMTLMEAEQIGTIIVVEGSTIVGIVTDRDILLKVKNKNLDPGQILLKSIMTPSPVTVNSDATLAQAIKLMTDGGFRHLPVVENNHLVQVLSISDLMTYIALIISKKL